jgi:hypothetical protein
LLLVTATLRLEIYNQLIAAYRYRLPGGVGMPNGGEYIPFMVNNAINNQIAPIRWEISLSTDRSYLDGKYKSRPHLRRTPSKANLKSTHSPTTSPTSPTTLPTTTTTIKSGQYL